MIQIPFQQIVTWYFLVGIFTGIIFYLKKYPRIFEKVYFVYWLIQKLNQIPFIKLSLDSFSRSFQMIFFFLYLKFF